MAGIFTKNESPAPLPASGQGSKRSGAPRLRGWQARGLVELSVSVWLLETPVCRVFVLATSAAHYQELKQREGVTAK